MMKLATLSKSAIYGYFNIYKYLGSQSDKGISRVEKSAVFTYWCKMTTKNKYKLNSLLF